MKANLTSILSWNKFWIFWKLPLKQIESHFMSWLWFALKAPCSIASIGGRVQHFLSFFSTSLPCFHMGFALSSIPAILSSPFNSTHWIPFFVGNPSYKEPWQGHQPTWTYFPCCLPILLLFFHDMFSHILYCLHSNLVYLSVFRFILLNIGICIEPFNINGNLVSLSLTATVIIVFIKGIKHV